jgi:hypothetical protein
MTPRTAVYVTGVLEGRPQIRNRSSVERVEHLRAVEGHVYDRALLLVEDGFENQRADATLMTCLDSD